MGENVVFPSSFIIPFFSLSITDRLWFPALRVANRCKSLLNSGVTWSGFPCIGPVNPRLRNFSARPRNCATIRSFPGLTASLISP